MCHEHAFGAAEDDPFPRDAGDLAVEGLGPGEGDVRPGERRSVRRDMLLHEAGRRHRAGCGWGRRERRRRRREIIHRNFSSPSLLSTLPPRPSHHGPRRLPRGPPPRDTPLPPRTALPRPQLRRPLRQGTRLVRRDQLAHPCQRGAFRRPVPRLSLDDYRRTP